MKSLIAFALVAAASAAAPAYSQYGEYCGRVRPPCAPGLACDTGVVVPRMYAGKCLKPRAKQGQNCDTVAAQPTKCEDGLDCVYQLAIGTGKGMKSVCLPLAKDGETCSSMISGNRTCAEGFECINKNQMIGDYPSICYKVGLVTKAKENEGCNGTTKSVCDKGLKCVQYEGLDGVFWCKKN